MEHADYDKHVINFLDFHILVGAQKFKVQMFMSVFNDKTGGEIEDDDVLELLPDGVRLMLLQEGEKWIRQENNVSIHIINNYDNQSQK